MYIGSGGSSGYCFYKLSSLEEVHYFYLLAGVGGVISLLVSLTIYIIHYLLYLRDMNVLCVYSIIISLDQPPHHRQSVRGGSQLR